MHPASATANGAGWWSGKLDWRPKAAAAVALLIWVPHGISMHCKHVLLEELALPF